MRYLMILLAGLAFVSGAQTVAPGAEGAIYRAKVLYESGNYHGAVDQLEATSDCSPAADIERRMLLAKSRYYMGEYNAAMIEYSALAEDYPSSAEALEASVGVADCLFAQGEYRKALDCYKEITLGRVAPARVAEINYRCGVCAFELDDTTSAVRYFTAAAVDGATRSAANFYLGVIAFNDGNYDKARQYFNQTNQGTEPGRGAPYYLACIEYAQGSWAKALSQARQVLKACPESERLEMLRIAGESLCRLGQKNDGLEYLRKYLAAAKEPAASALYLVGADDFANGNYELAVENLRKTVDSDDPKLVQSAYLFIGQSFMHLGDNDAALMSFDKATKIAGGDPDVEESAYYNYAVAKFEGAAIPFKSSAETFEEFLRRYPSGPYSERVAAYLAGGYLADKDYVRAVERIDRLARPSDAMLATKLQALYALAWTDCQSGDYQSAMTYVEKAAPLARYDAGTAAELDLVRAQILLRQGDNENAAKYFRSYLDKSPRRSQNRTVAYYGLAYSLYNLKNLSAARRAFTDALQGAGKDMTTDIYNRLGDISQATEDFASATSYYDKSAQANPGASDYSALQIAKMKGYQRDYNGKLSALEAFVRDYPASSLVPEALLETTQAQISLGRNEDAVNTYRRLIADYPSTSQGRRGYLEMAMTLLDMERRDEAIDAYRSVISLYPSSEEASQAATLLKNLYAADGRAADYLEFINSVDKAPRIDAAEAETLSYTSALNDYRSTRSTRQIEDFIARYPESGYRTELLGILLDDADRNGDEQKAADIAGQIISASPDSRVAERAMLVKARSLYDNGSIPEALEMYQQLKERSSDRATKAAARLGVMRAARDMGEYKLAADEADVLLASPASGEKDYSVAEAKFTKACALEADGKVDEAIALWQSGAANTSELYGAKSAYRAAEALFESGKNKQALSAAQKFVKSGSKQRYWVARGFILLSDIYKANGNKYEARQYLEALRENYPGDETDIKMMIESRLNDNE